MLHSLLIVSSILKVVYACMNKADQIILEKITNEINMGLSFIENLSISQFLEDELLKRASCMTIINIGELIKHLSVDIRQEYKDIPWKAIAGFRDIAAHKYQTLRMDDVYQTISSDFPTLLSQLESILEKNSNK